MPHKISAIDEARNKHELRVDKHPDRCPICKDAIRPEPLGAHFVNKFGQMLYVAFVCPSHECRQVFVGVYKQCGSTNFINEMWSLASSNALRPVKEVAFSKPITSVSSLFCKTFNQAQIAEDNSLDEIAGPDIARLSNI